jgi:hypothetical protein
MWDKLCDGISHPQPQHCLLLFFAAVILGRAGLVNTNFTTGAVCGGMDAVLVAQSSEVMLTCMWSGSV